MAGVYIRPRHGATNRGEIGDDPIPIPIPIPNPIPIPIPNP